MARVSVHLHSLCVLRTAWVYHLCDGSGGVLGLVVLVRVASGGFWFSCDGRASLFF